MAHMVLAVLLAVGCRSSASDGATATSSSGRDVAIIGDSITQQSEHELRSALADDGHTVRVAAATGRTFESSQVYADQLAGDRPDVVVIELGTNDIWMLVPLGDINAQVDAMQSKFEGSCVVMVTVNEHARDARSLDGTYYDNEQARHLNEVLVASADQVADWNAEANRDPARYLDQGTIHPTADGRHLLAALVDREVESCLSR